MTDQLTGLGVAFAANPACETNADAAGVAHRPWDQLPFSRLPQSARKFPRTLGLHVSTSLLNRLRAGPVKPAPDLPPAGYRPENLADYLDGVNPAPEVLIS